MKRRDVSGWIDEFLAANRAGWSDETNYKYGRILRDVGAALRKSGRSNIRRVRPADLNAWLENQTAWGPSQRHIAISAMRRFFAWALGVERSPARTLHSPRRVIVPQPTVSRQAAEALLASLDTSTAKGRRDLAILCLLFDQGLRASEICRLQLAHVDLEARTFVVRKKGGKYRRGAFSSYSQAALAGWLACRHTVARPGIETVFVSIRGTKPGSGLTRSGLGLIVRRLGRKAGIGPISPHMFRRAMAVMMIRLGAPQRLVELSGGWETPDEITRYTQALNPTDADPYFPMSDLMGTH